MTSAARGTRFVARVVCPMVLAFGVVLALATGVTAQTFDRLVGEALALCAAADRVSPDTRLPVLARGLDRAEAAVALDERSADAHFAIFCNLGKATELGGVGLGTFRAVYRLRQEIDVTLALAPNHAEALAAKGALLIKLPRWLGGDRRDAEIWLRRALAIDPSNATARAYLDELGLPPPFVAPASDTTVTQ